MWYCRAQTERATTNRLDSEQNHLQPETCDAGLSRITSTGATVLAETAYDTWDEAMLLLELLPDKPYVLVPSTVAAGVEAPFEIRCAALAHSCAWRGGAQLALHLSHKWHASQAAERCGSGARAAA